MNSKDLNNFVTLNTLKDLKIRKDLKAFKFTSFPSCT